MMENVQIESACLPSSKEDFIVGLVHVVIHLPLQLSIREDPRVIVRQMKQKLTKGLSIDL